MQAIAQWRRTAHHRTTAHDKDCKRLHAAKPIDIARPMTTLVLGPATPEGGRSAGQYEGVAKMATTKGTGRATLADLLAASELGAIDLSAEVVLASDADAALQSAQVAPTSTAGELPHDAHACGIPGCRHGASHGGPSQPDRQHKLSAPCGAVIRLTDRALGLAGGYGGIKCGHGDPFMTAARRTYSRKAV